LARQHFHRLHVATSPEPAGHRRRACRA
jgi:hypothetical protein